MMEKFLPAFHSVNEELLEGPPRESPRMVTLPFPPPLSHREIFFGQVFRIEKSTLFPIRKEGETFCLLRI